MSRVVEISIFNFGTITRFHIGGILHAGIYWINNGGKITLEKVPCAA